MMTPTDRPTDRANIEQSALKKGRDLQKDWKMNLVQTQSSQSKWSHTKKRAREE